MNRRLFCGGLGTVALALACGRPASASLHDDATPTAADADSYSIWSILIPLLRPDAQRYLIPLFTSLHAEATGLRPDKPLSPIESAMRGPFIEVQVPEYAREKFTEAAQKFGEKEQAPVMLERRLELARPYRLMNTADLAEYRRIKPPTCVVDPAHPWHRDKGLEKKYAGFASPCLFSRVYFDNTHTLGLVWAHSPEGVSETYSFEKEAGSWKRREWPSLGLFEEC